MRARPPTRPAPALRAACLLALASALAGCDTELYSGLGETEANELVSVLAEGRIPAHKQRLESGEWQVQVDADRVAPALALLRAQGLPQQRYASMGDMFQKQGLVSTPAEERMRYIFAVSQELSRTLRGIDGVVDARVHVVIPQDDPLAGKVRPSSAAVFIKHRPDVDLRLLQPAVKDLVAHSIEGLAPDQVSLSLFAAPRRAAGGIAAGSEGESAREVLGMSRRAVATLLVLLAAAAVALMALPTLLARRGLDWRTWLRRDVLRR